jgi:hypothetical protein
MAADVDLLDCLAVALVDLDFHAYLVQNSVIINK